MPTNGNSLSSFATVLSVDKANLGQLPISLYRSWTTITRLSEIHRIGYISRLARERKRLIVLKSMRDIFHHGEGYIIRQCYVSSKQASKGRKGKLVIGGSEIVR